MELSAAEQTILDRYQEKTRIAGGPRKGYVLRRQAIRFGHQGPEEELERGLGSLVDKGLLAPSEDRRFYFLTEAGVDLLGRR